ncbi:DNA-J chaperone, putative [Bodo saltans]|uniref:DNA-J chaperone, putative n=1 Tax=Bodo saltans TaxID=75058 RepID=A0A0S4J1C8_BODSA|nr:DNA-J chaperone, putative [Bodo saltans]|eukprot:CUG43629.1 DNA-J chaperone, putative [Bodo saltans]
MRCHYEVLNVDKKATFDEIRSSYKKQALLCHPDKNHGNTEEAAQRFKEVQNAYAVLSDATEREWYDAHRDSILNGDGEGTCAPDEINLYDYFSARCYTGFGDDDESFFTVYGRVFDTLIEEECGHSDTAKNWPKFGKGDAAYKDVAKFYAHWRSFNTNKTFAWKDEYKLNEIPDRQSRRAAERINMKERAAARKSFMSIVTDLTDLVMRRDPRVAAEKQRAEEEQARKDEEKKAREDIAAKRRREANEKLWAEAAEKEDQELRARQERGDHDDGEVLELLYEKQRLMEQRRKKGTAAVVGRADEALLDENAPIAESQFDVEDATEKFSKQCKACKKGFNAEKQWTEHLNSAKHKTRIKQLASKGTDVTALMGEDWVEDTSKSTEAKPAPVAPVAPSIDETSTAEPPHNSKKAGKNDKKNTEPTTKPTKPVKGSKKHALPPSESESEEEEEEFVPAKKNAFQIFAQRK